MNIIKELSSPEDITKEISHFYSTYHSIKYYNGIAYMRVNKSFPESLLTELNTSFSHLLSTGTYEIKDNTCTPEEMDQFPEKKRLVFSFNHKSYGGLVSLIHFINDSFKSTGGS